MNLNFVVLYNPTVNLNPVTSAIITINAKKFVHCLSICVKSSPLCHLLVYLSTVKPVLSGHLKIDKTKVLMEIGSVMKADSIAECSPYFDLH